MSEKTCCEWHDAMFPDEMECGLAGMGSPIVCCRNCPENDWFVKERKITPKYYLEDFTEEEREEL